MKKLVALLTAVALLLTVMASFASAEGTGFGLGTMFVYTENGKGLTDVQIQTGIEFLSNLDFIPAN